MSYPRDPELEATLKAMNELDDLTLEETLVEVDRMIDRLLGIRKFITNQMAGENPELQGDGS